MARAVLVLSNDSIREKAHRWLDRAAPFSRVEFKGPARTTDQNSKMWPMLTDIASQILWHGQRLTTEEWKQVFLDALNREMKLVPNLDGTGFVPLGRSSSDLSKAEFSDLLELIAAWGAQNGVVFSEPQREAA